MSLNRTIGRNMIKAAAVGLLVSFSGLVWAQDAPSECVELGALAFDNWTKTDAGGTGSLPTGETNGDYVRCTASLSAECARDVGVLREHSMYMKDLNPRLFTDTVATLYDSNYSS